MNTCRTAYIELRWISPIWNFLAVDATKTLMCSLVLLKLDYCNSLLSVSLQYLIQVLQKVQNTAAWITLRVPRIEHTSPLLCSLHWLSIKKRIKYKVCSLCYATLIGTGPKYMSKFVNVYIPFRCLCSLSDSRILKFLFGRTKTYEQHSFAYQGPSTWNDRPFDRRHKIHCPLSKVLWKLIFFMIQLRLESIFVLFVYLVVCNYHWCLVCVWFWLLM